MKKVLILLILTAIITSCSSPVIEEPYSENTSNTLAEEIYKSTGCRVKDAESILIINPMFADNEGNKYLGGSRVNEKGSAFWFSKYTSDGVLIWETIDSPKEYKKARAWNPCMLQNNDIIVACVEQGDGYNPLEMRPTILSSKDGTPKFINVKNGYMYSFVKPFKDCFICGIDEHELNANANAYRWYSQISNSGKIISSCPEMAMPYGETLWKDEANFVSADSATIKKGSTKEPTYKWVFYPQLPEYSSYKSSMSFNEDNIIINYSMSTSEGKVLNSKYELAYSTGVVIGGDNPDENPYKYLELKKEYLAPNNMTVMMNAIEISSNNEGTTYYTISYTLKNNTKTEIILEGSFDAYYNNYTKGDSQTGFFDNLYPGESKTRTYTFKTLTDNKFMFIQYKHKWDASDSEILKNSLKWKTN